MSASSGFALNNMKINREQFLNDLQMVKGGLSSKEFLQQSNSFVFRGGEVFTFNDEVACRKKCAFIGEGAIQADILLAMLEKIPDDVLEVIINDENQHEFRAKNKRMKLARDAEVLLPIEKVTEEVPKGWAMLPENFSDIINNVQGCVSTDEANNWALTCIHFHPEFIEACDNRHMLRWHVKLGHNKSMLVRATAIAQIIGLGMTQITTTQSWIHFRNSQGLIVSCRKFIEDYPDMSQVLDVTGDPIKLPKGIVDAANRASIMAAEKAAGMETTLTIDLRPGAAKITGEGLVGVYEEIKKVVYNGPPMRFIMTPQLLCHITQNYNDAIISERKLKASGGSKDSVGLWEYVTVLGRPKTATKAPPAAPVEGSEYSNAED